MNNKIETRSENRVNKYSESTPQRPTKKILQTPRTQEFSRYQGSSEKVVETDQNINFKEKCYELMKKVTDYQLKQRKYQAYIQKLEERMEGLTQEFQRYMAKSTQKKPKSQQKDKSFQLITKTQIQYFNPFEEGSKGITQKYRNIAQKAITKTAHSVSANWLLTNETLQLKQQLKKLAVQNSSLKSIIEDFETQLSRNLNAIQQTIEATNLKCDQYERRIDQLEKSQQKIKQKECLRLKEDTLRISRGKNSQGELNEVSSEISFGKKERKFSGKEEALQMEIECYRASIEGLLDENKKLKKSFLGLYCIKEGEEVSEELKKQVKIMKSILDLNSSDFN